MILLNEVIKLEEKIRCLLETAPTNYTPPICQFNCSPKKQQATQKKAPAAQWKASKRNPAVPDVNAENFRFLMDDLLWNQYLASSSSFPINRCSMWYRQRICSTILKFSATNYGILQQGNLAHVPQFCWNSLKWKSVYCFSWQITCSKLFVMQNPQRIPNCIRTNWTTPKSVSDCAYAFLPLFSHGPIFSWRLISPC